jgi:hypothetical protein
MELTKVAEVVRLHGVEAAREMASTPHERRLLPRVFHSAG